MTERSDITELSPLTQAAVTWLDKNYPDEDHCEPGWALASMIESRYPGGMAGLKEDLAQATAVS